MWFAWPGHSIADAALLEVWATEKYGEHGASKPWFPWALLLLR